MAETYGEYFAGLGRSIGQGVTLGFGDEIEAGIRALGPETYDEEVAKIRADLAKFQETNPVSAFAGELVGAVPTAVAGGAGLASLGIRGAARIGAVEGAIYGAGTGESAEGRALGAALGAPTGAVAGKVGEKAVEGIAPLVGKFMKRGSGSETRGSSDIQLDAAEQPRATVFDVETGVTSPLEKTVGEPRTSGLGSGGINPVTKDQSPGLSLSNFNADYSPIENALANAESVMNASPTKGLAGKEYLARLMNLPSVTKTEMNASGLSSFLARPENKNRKIPVAEVQQYMKENAPDIETFKYTGDNNDVSYRDTQRFMDRDAYSEVGYGEITTNNRNAHPATSGHALSHYRDQLGNFAHVRYSDHNDASGGVSRVIEENQFDLLQNLLSQERGGELSRISTVKLTPEKVADYDARIEKLRGSPEYPVFRQTGDDLVEAGGQLRSAEEVQKGFIEQRNNIIKKKRNKLTLATSQLGNAGKMAAGEGSPTDDFEALIQMVSPDFLEDTMFRAIRSIQAENQNYSPSSDEIGQIITRSINSTPEQLVSEIIEAAKKRGQSVPSTLPVGQQRIASFASKYATPAEKTMLLASSRIQTDAVFTYKNGFESVFMDMSPSDTALLSQDEASRIVRENMANAMSAPRRLKVTSDILEQDGTKVANLAGEINRAVDRVDAAKKAKTNAATEFESASKKLVRNNTAITGVIDKASGDDTKGFFEYAQKTNFLPREANPVDSAGRAQLVPNQPFDTPLQAARHNILMAVDDAVNEGVDRIYFPDYRDLAELREVNPEGFFKTVYKDAPEKVIKELKQKFPNLKTGRISPDEFVEDHLGEIGDEAQVTQPVLYLDLTPASMGLTRSAVRLGIPRRYAKGGPVDLRSGIGNMFRLYS